MWSWFSWPSTRFPQHSSRAHNHIKLNTHMASSWHDTHFSLEVPKGMSGVLQRCMWSFCNIMSTTLPRFNSDVNKPGVLRFLRPLPGLIDAVDLTPVRPKSSSHQQVHPKTKRVGFHSTPPSSSWCSKMYPEVFFEKTWWCSLVASGEAQGPTTVPRFAKNRQIQTGCFQQDASRVSASQCYWLSFKSFPESSPSSPWRSCAGIP